MNWYALNTKPHQEYLAQLSLQKLGVETFCPLLKQTKLIRRRRQTVIGPLFPGYLFARFNLEVQYRAVNYARGVRSVVTFGSDPAIVNEELIQSIQLRLHDGYAAVQRPSFIRGQTVRIETGPLQGLEAIFEQEISDQHRVSLLLQALTYQARVVVDLEHVVAC